MRLVIFGGEALDPGSLRPWIERHGDESPQLVNMYGITETTVHVTYRRLRAADLGSASVIGQPIPDLRLYLLDRHLQPVPAEVSGEIFVGGRGVARGYLGRPELTAVRFVPDPWSRQPGARLYRSGDAARRLADGDLEYAGRLDYQVKVRGFRIELGEIEQTLLRHPGVRAAVVMVQDGSPDDRRLIAGVAAAGDPPPSAADLRRFLAESLPAYMVPANLAVLDELPLTESGKIDRPRVAAAARSAAVEPDRAAPRTPTEQVLAALWSELLGEIEVSADDSFFDVGGHSLLGMQVAGRVRELFGVELPLQELFEASSLAELARQLDAAMKGDLHPLPPLVAVPRGGPLPASFAQRQIWLTEQMNAAAGRQNIPVALRFRGVLDHAVLARALSEVIARHEILRTTLTDLDGEPVQVVLPAMDVAIAMVDLAGLDGELAEAEVERLARAEARRPFSLSAGPLLRACMLRLSPRHQILLFTIHHIAADARSMEILVAELGALYAALRAGNSPSLPPVALHYGDFAAWQRRSLDASRRAAHIAYWRSRLAGAAPTFDLGPPITTAAHPRGVTLPLVIDAGLTERLRHHAQRSRATLFMTLLAAFKVVLRHESGRDDILIGSPTSLRDRREMQEIIGPFLNLLVLRTNLGRNPSFGELVDRVRRTTLEASLYRELPFDLLVEELQPERPPGRSPLAQVAFTLQAGSPRGIELEELSMEAFEVDRGESTFDLTLNLSDTGMRLRGFLEYRTNVLSSSGAQRLSGRLVTVLERIVEAPDPLLSELSELLASFDRQAGEAERELARRARTEALRAVKRRSVRNADAGD